MDVDWQGDDVSLCRGLLVVDESQMKNEKMARSPLLSVRHPPPLRDMKKTQNRSQRFSKNTSRC